MVSARPMVLEDIEAVLAAREMFDEPPRREGLEAFAIEPSHCFILGFFGEQVAGFVSLHILPRPDARPEGFLFEVSVSERYRRRGVARAMIQRAKREVAERGGKGLWVITNRSNSEAVALYESTGAKTENPDDVVYVWDTEE